MAIIAPFSFMATSFSVPQTVQNNAKRGLELRKKHGRGGLTTAEAGAQGIGSGVARARDLMGGSVSLETVKRMSAFFDRHRQNKDTPPEKGNGMISWLLWGGDAGDRWAKGILNRMTDKELTFAGWLTAQKRTEMNWGAGAGKPIGGGLSRAIDGKFEGSGEGASAPKATAAQMSAALADVGVSNADLKALRTLAIGDGEVSPSTMKKLQKLGFVDSDGGLTTNGKAFRTAVKDGNTEAIRALKPEAGGKAPKAPKGGKAPKPAKPSRAETEAANIKTAAAAMDKKVPSATSSALVGFSQSGEIEPAQAAALSKLGLLRSVDGGHVTTSEGNAYLSALKRGDTAKANEALLKAADRLKKEAARQTTKSLTFANWLTTTKPNKPTPSSLKNPKVYEALRRQGHSKESAARISNAMVKRKRKNLPNGSIWVIKDKSGKYRWVSISSNSYEDREGEIVSQKALETAVNRGDLGNLHWWHDNGAVIGTADFQMMHGKMLIESGTFKSEKIGAAFVGKKGLGVSVGFLHPPTEPQDGIYHNIRIVERSVLPAKKAANGLTRFSAT